MSSTYRISITGIQTGIARDTAIKQLAELLKVTEEKVASMLNSPKHVVKSGVDLKSSAKYEDALQKCGCNVVVEHEGTNTEKLTFDLPENGQQEKYDTTENRTVYQNPPLIQQVQWKVFKALDQRQRILIVLAVMATTIVALIAVIKSDYSTIHSKRDQQQVGSQSNENAGVTTPKNNENNNDQSSRRIAPAGTVYCLNVRSFYKVNAIEMTGNEYASLPDDCMTLSRAGIGVVVQYLNDPIVGSVVLMDAGGTQAYIRLKDLQ